MEDVWKEYDNTQPSHSTIHHLMAIHTLFRENGYARGIDIAKNLNISRSSVSTTLGKCREKGYVIEDQNRFYRLSSSGVAIVNSILARRRILEEYLHDVLHLSYADAQVDACKVEHLLSEETIHRMKALSEYYLEKGQASRLFREGFEAYIHVKDVENGDKRPGKPAAAPRRRK